MVILIVVAIWYYGFVDSLGVEVYAHTVNVTRELLTSLHDQALDFEEEGEGEGDDVDTLQQGKKLYIMNFRHQKES